MTISRHPARPRTTAAVVGTPAAPSRIPTAPLPAVAAPVVVIPALAPDSALPDLVRRLAGRGIEVVVVDDGSGPGYDVVFDRCAVLGAVVAREAVNRGKGAALRRALALVQDLYPGAGVVTADADGQHALVDVLAVRDRLMGQGARGPERPLVLGVRTAERVGVPLRSRLGNAVSAALFRLAGGVRLADTQTGLRGIPAEHLDWARSLPGDRYEYETTMLLRAARGGIGLDSIAIRTVYLEDNASSHFRPLRDSVRVLAPMLAFAASGLLAFAVDTGLFVALIAATGLLWPSLIGARLVSAGVNFAVNRGLVFRAGHAGATDSEGRSGRGRMLPDLLGYAAVAALVALGGGLGIDALMALGVPVLAAKVLADLSLFCVSYALQRAVVFGRRTGRTEA